jgi:hypothetical protein
LLGPGHGNTVHYVKLGRLEVLAEVRRRIVPYHIGFLTNDDTDIKSEVLDDAWQLHHIIYTHSIV